MTDYFEIIIIEIPKVVKAYQKTPNDEVLQWMLFLDNPEKEEVSRIMEENKDIKEAKEELDRISQDDLLRRRVLNRTLEIADQLQMKKELEEAANQIKVQEETVKHLEERIQQLEKNPLPTKTKEDLEDEIKYITEAKNKAEREKAKLETNIEKMKQQQKEKEQRQTQISDAELKRINSIAKAEQALAMLETNFDILKNNKNVIKTDYDVKVRLEILKNRMDDLLSNI